VHRTICALILAGLVTGCLAQPTPRFTALADAAREGDVDTMQRILATGVSPNVTDTEGNQWTPLLHAIHKNQRRAVDLLLRSGADPRLAVHGLQPLLMAVGTGNAPIVRRLLDAGADPRSDEAIFLTAVAGGALSDLDNPLLGRCNTDVVQALVDRAPDLRLNKSVRSNVALAFARFNACQEVIRLTCRPKCMA
jgi:ankyrin repeat protein